MVLSMKLAQVVLWSNFLWEKLLKKVSSLSDYLMNLSF